VRTPGSRLRSETCAPGLLTDDRQLDVLFVNAVFLRPGLSGLAPRLFPRLKRPTVVFIGARVAGQGLACPFWLRRHAF